MTALVTHKFVSSIPDGADTSVVRPSNWNDTHDITGTIDPVNGGTGQDFSASTGFIKVTAGTMSASGITASDVSGLATVATTGLASSLTNDEGWITSAEAPVQSVAGKTGVVTLTSSDVGLGNVTNDAQTRAAIVPNTAPAAGEILVGNAGGTAYAKAAMSGDATLASTGAITVTQARGLRETAGPTTLAMGAVADGQFLVRSGTSIVGSSSSGGGLGNGPVLAIRTALYAF